jgi:hypothetical protein
MKKVETARLASMTRTRFRGQASKGWTSKCHQRGATFFGMVIIVGILGFALYAGIRLFPLYKEYFDIVRAMSQTSTQLGEGSSPADIKQSLQRRWQIEDIKSIEFTDIEINRTGEATMLRAKYRAEAPFVGNVSLVVDFDKSVKMGSAVSL